MPSDASQLLSYVVGFALVAVRVTGAFFFVPFPGPPTSTTTAKVLLILSITFSLFALWPHPDPAQPLTGLLIFGILKEAAVGVSLGLVVSLAGECFSFCFHLLGLQAGYSFASTIDPSSQADSTVLETIGHLAAGLLFFTTGFHRSVIHAFAVSLESHPAGTWTISPGLITPVLQLFQSMLSAGVRLALPVMASMMLIDIALALAGRMSTQLQLVTLAFPVKMLATLLLIAWLLRFVPSIFSELSGQALDVVTRAMFL